MSDLTTLNNLFIEQYGSSTKFIQFVDGVLGIMQNKFMGPLDILDEALDLDNVEGILLDYIGIRLGFTRPTVTAAGEFFGFDTGQTDNNFGWNQRPFFTSIEVLQTKTPVSDDIYRTLLKARGRFIRSSPTYEDVEAILDILYGEGNWSITESTTGLSFVIRYSSSANSVIVSIVDANKQFLIPRAAGVACTVMSEFSLQVVMDMINVIGDVVDVTLPAASGGATPITYAVTGLPTGLSFDTTTRDITGTVGGTAEVSMVTYTATDDNGTVITRNFDWETEAANQPPVARAGADQTGVTAGATFTLDGSASSDPDGTIASQQWTQTAGDTVALADATALMTTGVAPSTNTAQTLTFSLVVTDDDGLDSVANTVDIGVLAIVVPNQPPVARTGANQTGIVAGATVNLDGSASSDPDGTISTYAWSQTSGTTVSLSDATIASPTFTAPSTDNAQTLTFELTVTDNDGATNTDTVDIAVLAYVNMPPVSRAGSDQSNITAGATVTLDGSASSDPDGTIASYAWSQTSGTTVVLSSTSVASPTFTAPSESAAQTLTFQLTVTDDDGATNSDTVDIGVLAIVVGNQSPVASAGPDQSDIVAGSTVTLDSSGSNDPDGTIASRVWSQTLGDTVVLSDTTAVSPTFTAPSTDSAQTLLFEVRVTDNDGATDIDSVQIGVLAQVAQMSVFDSLAALTGVNNAGTTVGSYVIDVTTSAMQQDYWEFSPAEGTLHQNFPTDMFTNTAIYWIERFRVQNNGASFNIHRGASTVLSSAFEGTWTDDWAWYIYSVDTGEYLIFQANDESVSGGGFITYTQNSWSIVAQSTGTMTSTEWLNSLAEERVIVALTPTNTYRP